MKSKKAIPALIEISTNNPFIVYRIINEKKVPTYPLREKAEQALQMLR
jgi:hypothetical protein